jgi:undecaprenyl-phosphate 4-deoxy-4-formamido-L-arabinose transferase
MPCKLTIVVPVYRSATILPVLVETIQQEMYNANLQNDFEVLLDNDASPDSSGQVIHRLAKQYPFVRGISLRRNFGQHNATMAGLNHAIGNIIVIMDDDLQHPPKAVIKMIKALDGGHDVCYVRYLNRQHALWKRLIATHLLGKPKDLYLSSFKAVRKEVVAEVIKYDGPYAYLDGLILDVTQSITNIDVEHQPRHEGEGNYNFRRSLSLWFKMATSFSVIPLRLATYLGFAITGFSVMMICYVIILKMLHPDISAGWTSLIATILLIGGVQTMCIGIIGEYLGRAYLKLNGKPQFVVAHYTGKDSA